MTSTSRLKQSAFIGSMHDLWTWKTAERNLLIQWHEFLNGNHPYVVANFLSAPQFENTRSNATILASVENQCREADLNIKVRGRRWVISDNANTFHFWAEITCLRLIPGSKCEWLLMLEGALKNLSFEEGETQAKMACYYDTSRGEGFALMPNLAREQLYSHYVGR